ncbi:hypothetical protein AB0B28_08280 [Glycomyces sp. NPDC046736]|uniref:hypothetical protein n=1 Tax=Glycomyces sp. NPDC046736 TaxID=3155615 RepID=UPI0033F24E0D
MGFELSDDYVDVAERITEFRDKHPEGSFQQLKLDFVKVAGKDWVVYTAAAYRDPDDKRPGMGTAWEEIPGRTPYTKGSEVQNAETSAWGRAIVAALAADTKRGIASAQEVRNRRAESFEDATPAPPQRPPFNPGPEAAELMASVLSAVHKGALTRVWKRIAEASTKQIITKAEADALRAKATERAAALPPDPDTVQDAAEDTQDTPTSPALEGELIENGTPA